MFAWALFAPLAVLLAGALADFSGAAPHKLDAPARAALARIRRGEESIEAMRARGVPIDRRGDLDVFIRGAVTRQELEAAGARVRTALPGLFTASIPPSAVEGIAALDRVVAIRAGAPCAPELDASVPATGAQLLRGPGPGFVGLNGEGVLIGIVDSGIDYQHGDFLDSTGATRIISIWDQVVSGTGIPGYPYGKEWTQSDIDLGICPEVDDLEHGTHLAGIAAGDGSQTGGAEPAFTYAGMAPRADLVVVKTDFLAPEVIDAVSYVFDKAAVRAASAVVNLSLGTQFGSHDGNSDFEQALNALVGPGRIVVKSAGNDRGRATHAEVFATTDGASATVSVSGSALHRYFLIDGYYDAREQLRVMVRTPGGTIIGPLPANAENAPWPGQVTSNGTVYVVHDSLTHGRKNVYVQVQVDQSNKNMNGTWTITMLADALGPTTGEVDFWRYDADQFVTANFVAGNQSTQELVSEPGNAPDVITVGAWVTKRSWTCCNGLLASYSGMPGEGDLGPFSSPGPTRDGRLKPDLVAPGTAIGSTTSFDVVHSCPAPPTTSEFLDDAMNHRVHSGTSLSAAHVTGAVAVLLQKFGAMTPAEVRSYLQTHARADAFTGSVPSADWGYGKLDLGDLTDPVVQVVSPNGAETVSGGELVSLTWTATDVVGGVAVVDLQLSREGPDGPFENIALGVPNTGSHDWTVTPPATAPGAAWFRVEAHDAAGNVGEDLSDAGFSITDPVGVADNVGVPAFEVSRVSPNPTRRAAAVAFAVPRESQLVLSVRDIMGRTVAVLVDGPCHAGRHHATWDGRQGGVRARAGLYFICLDTPEGQITRRIAVVP